MPPSDRWGRALFWCALVLGAIDRTRLLTVFGFACTGIDDALIWEMARDYGHGLFREPYMYGQNYNPMLEALIGAPFVRLFGHPWIVMPIVTSVLALLPYWSFALWRARHKEFASATAFAVMPLLLSSEWGILTTETRGFVHGIALLALLPITLSLRNERMRFLSSSLVMATALLCNPNALFLVVPVCMMLLFRHGRSLRFWVLMVLGTLPAAAFWATARHFFDDHPWDLKHSIDPAEMMFDPHLIATGMGRLDSHFQSLSPLFWPNGHTVLWLLIATVGLLFVAGKRPQAWAVIATVAMMLVALGIPKVHDGGDSVFYARSRMFLAAPLLLAWALGGYFSGKRVPAQAAPWLFGVMVLLVSWKWYAAPVAVERALAGQEKAYVREERVQDLRLLCEGIEQAARRSGATVVAPIRWPGIKVDHKAHFQAHFVCYVCASLIDGSTPTYGPGYDRRSWVHATFAEDPAGQVLFVGGVPSAWKAAVASGLAVDRSTSPDLLLHSVECDTMTVDATIAKLGVDDDLAR
ncbi:MAG: hypothetical protein KA175_11280 [Flavobacteriales bacterium]|nr:hypothetical protein [Flavobacteriales bacterium]MBP6698193.1 hypothetical protein [Flavobacteriales bacterium]